MVHSPNLLKINVQYEWGSENRCSIITFHVRKLWKTKFFILCDVIFLVKLLLKIRKLNTLGSERVKKVVELYQKFKFTQLTFSKRLFCGPIASVFIQYYNVWPFLFVWSIYCPATGKFPAEKFAQPEEKGPGPSQPQTGPKKVVLNSSDELYGDIRDLNFSAVGIHLSRKAKQISAAFEVSEKFFTNGLVFQFQIHLILD